MGFIVGKYDVIVVGAGHAGVEAALAAARMGGKTLLATLSLDNVALMPCNPSIGGPAKGHLVREIDALGGQMGLSADKACIQMRLLNTGKGYAVHALRAQEDKPYYTMIMKQFVENQPNLELKQLMIDRLLVENGEVVGVEAETGEIFEAKCVILATGTYLRARIVYGQVNYESGPNGLRSANKLSGSLLEHGVELMRFKTGTPARIDALSLDYSKMEVQNGDDFVRNFSFLSDIKTREQIPCWLTYTNADTHKIVRDNLHLSGMFNGLVEGIGPRYCPSIEAKLVRFAEKERHQLFIEPEGRYTNEMYVQGMSTSMPHDVQRDMYASIAGLENADIMRYGYAIEYDCINTLDVLPTLEFKKVEGIYTAGQINGTSGYEEAAAQGLMAGLNASLKLRGLPPFTLRRDEAYIGVLIDDLVTKGTDEPYRMMTSRAEHRICLRQDNADFRLTEKGKEVGLVTEERYQRYLARKAKYEELLASLQTRVPQKEAAPFLVRYGYTEPSSSVSYADMIKRSIPLKDIMAEFGVFGEFAKDVLETAEITVKYEGYLKQGFELIEKAKRLEEKLLPPDIDYMQIKGLRLEAQEKLDRIRPFNLGQAGRISGVNPADVSVLMVWLATRKE